MNRVLGMVAMTDAEFMQTVKNHIDDATEKLQACRDIATEFEIAPSTVMRWATGNARPHPYIQLQVVRWIEEHA